MRHVVLALCLLASSAAAEVSLKEATSGMVVESCYASAPCGILTVPLDPSSDGSGRSLEIEVPMYFSPEESQGILFYVMGGQGDTEFTRFVDANVVGRDLDEKMDIVFFDQIATGLNHRQSCAKARAAFDLTPAAIADIVGIQDAVTTFVSDCLAELYQGNLLIVTGLDYAVRNIEAFRQKIGAPKVWLYGSGDSTRIVQTYAAQYPDAINGVILDGVIDLSLGVEGYLRTSVLAAEKILSDTFTACFWISECEIDMGGDAADVYDGVHRLLSKGPVMVPITLKDGSRVERPLTTAILEMNAMAATVTPEARAEFLRVLAAAGRNDLQPMVQLGYANARVDPDKLEVKKAIHTFYAAHVAILCSQEGGGEISNTLDGKDVFDEARALAAEAPRLLRFYYLERLICTEWPKPTSIRTPRIPFSGGEYPTLILGATADPIAPLTMGYSIFDKTKNAYGVFVEGEGHVVFGRGIDCVDQIVKDLLIRGNRPPQGKQTCPQNFIAPYVPLTLTKPSERANPVTVVRAIITELGQFAPYRDWDFISDVHHGCPYGGIVRHYSPDEGYGNEFHACKFWPDLSLTGRATFSQGDEDGVERFYMDVSVEGSQIGDIDFKMLGWDADQMTSWEISGTWNGQPIAMP